MSRELLDASSYMRAPNLTVAEAVTLGQALVEGGGDVADARVLLSRRRLAARVEELRDAWARRGRLEGQPPAADPREVDWEADRTWRALHGRLAMLADLPGERYPRAARAGALLRTLFGAGGLEFLTHPFAEQCAAMELLLDRIAAEDLAGDIDDLAGPELLVHLHDVQRRYAAMVSEALRRMEEGRTKIPDRVRAVQRAISDYALQVCAAVDEGDPESVARAVAALAPIANARAAAARRREATREAAAAKNGAGAATSGPKQP